MSNADRKMKRAQSKEHKEEVKWDDLIPLYKDINKNLSVTINAVKEIGTTFTDVLNMDKNIQLSYIGVTKTLTDLTGELVKVMSTHSRKTKTKDGKSFDFKPYIGVVDLTDEAHQKVYTYAVMAYAGMSDKISAVIDNVMSTLLGNIKEAAARLGLAVDEKITKIENGEKDGE